MVRSKNCTDQRIFPDNSTGITIGYFLAIQQRIHLCFLTSIGQQIPCDVVLSAGTLDETREPALHYLLAGEVRVEGPGRPLTVAGAGRTIGAVETLTGASLQRRALVSHNGRALRLDRQDLFEVLADHSDLLLGVFSSVLDSGRTTSPP